MKEKENDEEFLGFSYIAMHTVTTACRNVVLFSTSVVQDLTFLQQSRA